MRKIIAPWLLIMTGMAILLTPYPQVGRAAVPSQLKCPSCDSFGVQRFRERKEAPAFSLNSLDGKKISLSDFKGNRFSSLFGLPGVIPAKRKSPCWKNSPPGKGIN